VGTQQQRPRCLSLKCCSLVRCSQRGGVYTLCFCVQPHFACNFFSYCESTKTMCNILHVKRGLVDYWRLTRCVCEGDILFLSVFMTWQRRICDSRNTFIINLPIFMKLTRSTMSMEVTQTPCTCCLKFLSSLKLLPGYLRSCSVSCSSVNVYGFTSPSPVSAISRSHGLDGFPVTSIQLSVHTGSSHPETLQCEP
jgi:hypothetical protein